MALIRFGAECGLCHKRHGDYSVEDIASCEDCGLDLCDRCAFETDHFVVREADEGKSRERGCLKEEN